MSDIASDVKKDEQANDISPENDNEKSTDSSDQQPIVPVIPSSPVTETELTTTDDNIILNEVKLNLDQMSNNVKMIAESTEKTATEMRELLKLYHYELVGQSKNMQKKLDKYHEMEMGRYYDGILAELANLYNNYEYLIDKIDDEKTKKTLGYMFDDLKDIIENKGATKLKSQPGDKRNTRHSQVNERIYTDNPDMHDTVAKSKSTGFYIEHRTLLKETVDVYIYSDSNDNPEQAAEQAITIQQEEN